VNPEDILQQLIQQYGVVPTWGNILAARGEREGSYDPRLQGLTREQLARLDRTMQIASTRQTMGWPFALGDVIANIGYDALKSSGLLPYATGAVRPFAPELARLATPGPSTSQPNFWANVKATMQGLY